MHVDRWVIGFLGGLAGVHKYSVFMEITERKSMQLFLRLFTRGMSRLPAYYILRYMLLSIQHTPDYIHKIAGGVPRLVNMLDAEDQSDGSSRALKTELSCLMHCLMTLHSGFPDLYEPIMEAFKDAPRPSQKEIRATLALHKWGPGSTHLGGAALGGSGEEFGARSDTGLTGLINLSNTCYVNSVVQALFMTDRFRVECQTTHGAGIHPVLEELQKLFAFLAFTQRAAVSPEEFVNASRPPWFAKGAQQDCSEFLKHLLNLLHEQELAPPGASPQTSGPSPKAPGTAVTPAAASRPLPLPSLSKAATRLETRTAGVPPAQSTNLKTPASTAQLSSADSNADKPKMKKIEGVKVDAVRVNVAPLTEMEKPGGVVAMETSESDTSFGSGGAANRQVTLVERNFGGRLLSSCRCLRCGAVSAKSESFTDLALGFPDTEGGGEGGTVVGGEDSTNRTGAAASGSASLTRIISDESAASSNSAGSAPPGPQRGSLAAPGNPVTLSSLLEHYLRVEKLVDDNSYQCDACARLVDGERVVVVTTAPAVLIVTLLRFAFDARANARAKIMTDVRFSRILRLPVQPLGAEWVGGLEPPPRGVGAMEFIKPPGDRKQGTNIEGSRLEEKSAAKGPSGTIGVGSPTKKLLDASTGSDVGSPRAGETKSDATGVKSEERADRGGLVKFLKNIAKDSPKRNAARSQGGRSEEGGAGNPPAEKDSTETYCLTAVVVHSGSSSESGHYYCYARHATPVGINGGSLRESPPWGGSGRERGAVGGTGVRASTTTMDREQEDCYEDVWFLFNDARVTQTSFDHFADITARFPTDTPYVLIYQKVTGLDLIPAGGTHRAQGLLPRELPLAPNLRALIDRDNRRYIEERERLERERVKKSSQSSINSSIGDPKDPPGEGGPKRRDGQGGSRSSCNDGEQDFHQGPRQIF